MCDVRCAAVDAAHWAMDDDDVARSWELGARIEGSKGRCLSASSGGKRPTDDCEKGLRLPARCSGEG